MEAAAADPRALALDLNAIRQVRQSLAPATQSDEIHWDRLSLLAAAIVGNPSLAEARAKIATAEAEARQSRIGPAPALTLTAEYANDTSASSPWLLGGAIDIPLDLGGTRTTRIETAALSVQSARYAYAEALWAARMAIVRGLADHFSASAQARLYRELGDLYARQMAAMERRLAAGEVSRADLERVRAEGADAARNASDAEARSATALRQVAEAVGVSPAALPAAGLVWQDFDAPGTDAVPASDELRHKALLARADIGDALVGYQQSENGLKSAVAKQYPAVTIGPGYTWERGLVKVPFSLGLVLPPLDLNRHAIATAEAKRAEAGRHLETVVVTAQAAIDRALTESRAARAALVHIRQSEAPTANRLALQADRELKAGAIDRVEWASARAGALRARIAESQAVARLHAADAALEDALRRPLAGPELAIANREEEIAR